MTNKTIEIPAKIIRGAMVCQGTNDVRVYLNAVLFDGDSGKVVATDGRIMFISEVECLKGAFAGQRILQIPQKIPKAIDMIDFDIANNTLLLKKYLYDDNAGKNTIQQTGTQLNAKLIDAQYPDYNAVINGELENNAVLNSIGLHPGLVKRAVNALELPAYHGHVWTYGKGSMTVSCHQGSNNNSKVIMMPVTVADHAN